MATQKLLLVNPTPAPKKRRTKPRTAAQKRATKKLIAFNKARARLNAKRPPTKKRKPATKRKSTMAARRKRRTAAQRAATKKLVAFNKRRRKNPSSSSRSRRRAYAASRTAAAPRRRRRSVARRAAPIRRRRNPIGGRGIVNTTLNNVVIPAVTATGGALALDLAWGYLPIPLNLKTGGTRLIAKSIGAIALAKAAGLVVSKRTANQMGVGALTVVLHEAVKGLIATNAPAIKMDGLGYYSPALPSSGYEGGGFEDVDNMGMYVSRPGAVGMGMYTNNGGEGFEDMGESY